MSLKRSALRLYARARAVAARVRWFELCERRVSTRVSMRIAARNQHTGLAAGEKIVAGSDGIYLAIYSHTTFLPVSRSRATGPLSCPAITDVQTAGVVRCARETVSGTYSVPRLFLFPAIRSERLLLHLSEIIRLRVATRRRRIS